ncbi:hypothetical protein [uncultured Friedmanniella sp.]|uniref:hypothetical protein n=1 Tax=uncultured Friedmanniella sp. TaxID=335381 RepID=UPI0035C9DD9F
MPDTLRCCWSGCDQAPAFVLSAMHTISLNGRSERIVCADHLAGLVVTLDDDLLERNPLDTLNVAHLGRRPLTEEDVDRGNAAMKAAQAQFYQRHNQADVTAPRTG